MPVAVTSAGVLPLGAFARGNVHFVPRGDVFDRHQFGLCWWAGCDCGCLACHRCRVAVSLFEATLFPVKMQPFWFPNSSWQLRGQATEPQAGGRSPFMSTTPSPAARSLAPGHCFVGGSTHPRCCGGGGRGPKTRFCPQNWPLISGLFNKFRFFFE